MSQPGVLSCTAVTGVGEVHEGDDLAQLVTDRTVLRDGDVLVVTSKVVSKSEGRVLGGDRASALEQETDRVLATRGATSIVRTRHGLVMAAAGIDASNTTPGTVVLLPLDPDASARGLRENLAARNLNVAVLVTDTSGRAWRNGQTDIAIGAAGIAVLHSYSGRTDGYGNLLAVTAPAIADEVAGTADLVKGKLGRSPFAVVRGLADLVLPRGEHGTGAGGLVRDEAEDMFGYGAREAVRAAVAGAPPGLRGFGSAVAADDLVRLLTATCRELVAVDARVLPTAGGVEVHLAAGAGLAAAREVGRAEARLAVVGYSMGWLVEDGGDLSVGLPGGTDLDIVLRFRLGTP